MKGHATAVSISKSSPTDQPVEFLSSSIKESEGLIGGDGSETRNGRSRHLYHKTLGLLSAGGTLTLEPRPDDLDLYLELAMGSFSADTGTLTETLPSFYVDQKYGSVDAIRFSSGKMARCVFGSRTGGKFTMSADCEFLTFDDSITYPSFALTDFSTKIPYAHHNAVLTIDGTAFASPSFEVVIDNMIDTGRFENSRTRVDLEEGDRSVQLRCDPMLAAAVKTKFGAAVRSGLAATLAYTLGSDSITFTFACLQMQMEGAELSGKNSDIRRSLVFDAVETNSAKELVVTNVSA